MWKILALFFKEALEKANVKIEIDAFAVTRGPLIGFMSFNLQKLSLKNL